MLYRRLAKTKIERGDYSIVPIRAADIMVIKQWRNEQMSILRQSRVLTDEDQRKYYNEVIVPSFDQDFPRLMLFSYFYRDRIIGYGGLTNLDWVNERAEISFLVETSRNSEEDRETYENDFGHFLRLMQTIAFHELPLHRLYTETFDIRPFHVEVLEKNGFRAEGRMKGHVKIDGNYVDSILHGCLKGYEDV